MKKLEELGISPAPWKYIGYHYHKNGEYIHLGEVVMNAGRRKIIYDLDQPTARLIAAAPDLYEALREAVIDRCTECHEVNDYESDIEIEWQMCRDCPARKWRAALAKAAGESEAEND